MILETNEVNDYHENGQLQYRTVFATIAPMWVHLYENKISFDDGTQGVRQGLTQRFWDNGQLNWQLEYSENGELIQGSYKGYRKDGSAIVY
jgi:antitoxin component YwqK of YwqJK toxin-antitoxin module